ncbi:MAG: DUF1885 family protein [Paenibacillaceae bacterium]
MSQRAYIKLVGTSVVPSVTLDDLKSQLTHYREQLAQTGSQLDWSYADAAFPYTIEQNLDGEGQWFYLKGNNPLYRYIAFGIEATEPCIIQVILPKGSTIGDKSKGNEFCKYLGKIWKAEVHLFNGRIMYLNPRK